MKKIFLAAALAATTIASAQAADISGLINTGASLVTGAQDSNYQLSVLSGNTVLPSDHAYITQDWAGPWLSNSGDSRWITPTANQGQSLDPYTPGVYQYALSFNVTGADAATAAFNGRFSADNSVVVMLNGQQIAGAAGFWSWTDFSVTSGLHSGVNTLDFVVTNYAQFDGNPTGLRVEFLTAAVPEPSSYAMLLAGVGLLGWVGRRRKV